METFEISTIELGNNLIAKLAYAYDYETPNQVYGCWKQVDYHQAGTTVRDPETGTNWVNECSGYTPALLASDYHKQGRENPSREAYESLQSELISELYGNMMIAIVTIEHHGQILAQDNIGFAYHDNYDDSIEDMTKSMCDDYFDLEALYNEALQEAADCTQALQEALPIIKTQSFTI